MNLRYFYTNYNIYRNLDICNCQIEQRITYNQNFNLNRRKLIGILFDSIELLCGLNQFIDFKRSNRMINYTENEKGDDIEYIINFYDDIKYIGNVIDGKFNGSGKIFIRDKLYYEGFFKNNLFHGDGILYSNYCDYYNGKFYNGYANGYGEIRWCNGISYKGLITKNLINGLGIYKYYNGSYYDGNFKNGFKSGEGKYICIFENNIIVKIYSKDWKNDLLNGKGEIQCKNMSYNYKGDIKTAINHLSQLYILPYGLGVLTNNEGIDIYVGKFVNGRKEGNGNEYYDNGIKKYSGGFILNHYHGEGKLYDSSGKVVYDGDFYKGTKHGKGWVIENNLNELSTFKFDKKFGKSVVTNNDLKIDINYYVGKNIVSEKIKNSTDEICPICQCNFKKNELITKLNKCGHTFHSECVFAWLQNNETCPMCRETNLFEKVNSKKRKLESN